MSTLLKKRGNVGAMRQLGEDLDSASVEPKILVRRFSADPDDWAAIVMVTVKTDGNNATYEIRPLFAAFVLTVVKNSSAFPPLDFLGLLIHIRSKPLTQLIHSPEPGRCAVQTARGHALSDEGS